MTPKTRSFAFLILLAVAERESFAVQEFRVKLSTPEAIYDGADGVLNLNSAATRVFVDARGTAYVLDWKDGTLFSFARGTRKPRSIGGRGDGPGEFSGATALGWLGDTLWVSGSRNSRVTMLPAWGTGRPLTFTFVAAGASDGVTVPAGLSRNGFAIVQRSSLYSRDRERYDRDARRVPVMRMTRDGRATVDTLFHLDLAKRLHEVSGGDGNGVFIGRQPFVGQDLWAVSTTGEFIASVIQPRQDQSAVASSLELRNSVGRVMYRRPLQPLKPAPSHAMFARLADSLLGVMNTGRDGRRTNEFSKSAYYEHLTIPRSAPVATKVLVSESGATLVRGADLGESSVTHSIWSVKGTLNGTFALPAAQMVCGFTDDEIWSLMEREDGGISLVRQRIAR